MEYEDIFAYATKTDMFLLTMNNRHKCHSPTINSKAFLKIHKGNMDHLDQGEKENTEESVETKLLEILRKYFTKTQCSPKKDNNVEERLIATKFVC